ncbi:MAG: hypothetical protein B6D61_10675 [Bacteroidetes bacterium 4484_249]|nr:MAG: hypothetical protein B6D61_10675 [Bacteroidetes bacterium 4484_249]
MQRIIFICFLVSGGFLSSFSQMQTTITKPGVKITQWENNGKTQSIGNTELGQILGSTALLENEMINIPLDYNGEAGVFIMGEEGITSTTFEVTLTFDFIGKKCRWFFV